MTEGIPTPDHRELRTPESKLSDLSFAELERLHQEIRLNGQNGRLEFRFSFQNFINKFYFSFANKTSVNIE